MEPDYKLKYREGFRILHLTDIQLIDSTQERTPDRLRQDEYDKWTPDQFDFHALNMCDDMVRKTNPDLILIEGDSTYGEFDDNGNSLKTLIKRLDSYGIPFAMVYGNHDNESVLGIEWQTEVIQSARNAMFKPFQYSIGLYDDKGEPVRTIIMLHTHGVYHASEKSIAAGVLLEPRLSDEEIEYVKSFAGDRTPKFVCQHIIPKECFDYYLEHSVTAIPFRPYKSDGKDGQFGELREQVCWEITPVHGMYKAANVDNVYFGHDHKNNLSTVIDGIRYTYVMKTGHYDFHYDDMLGGTLTVLTDNGRSVSNVHVHSDK